MEYAEDDYLMISGIQHFRFCKRQWALIHIEQQWAENEHTVIGELMHKKAHDPYLTEKRRDTIIARALPVASREMGVTGECDVVEFHRCEDGIRLHGHRGNFFGISDRIQKGKTEDHRGRQITISCAGNVPGRNVFHTDSGRCTVLRRDKTEGNRGDHGRTSQQSA